ncbi:hypothetical protein EDB85DRAFT_1146346 [Lactarius pseudohatsudake]|nr:hypothetical protein EDB85DRAFT_1146346 [Lactarius pseudohatsudake]
MPRAGCRVVLSTISTIQIFTLGLPTDPSGPRRLPGPPSFVRRLVGLRSMAQRGIVPGTRLGLSILHGASVFRPSPRIRASTICPEAGFEPAKVLVRATAIPTAIHPSVVRGHRGCLPVSRNLWLHGGKARVGRGECFLLSLIASWHAPTER